MLGTTGSDWPPTPTGTWIPSRVEGPSGPKALERRQQKTTNLVHDVAQRIEAVVTSTQIQLCLKTVVHDCIDAAATDGGR